MEFLKLGSQRKGRDKCIKIAKIENWKDNEKGDEKGGSFLSQFIAIIGVYILMINGGIIISWTSPALPHLKSSSSKFPVSDSQGAWIAALSSLCTIIGIILCPIFMDKIGRRYTMLLFASLELISGIIIILAENYIYLYIAKIIAGTGLGGAYNVVIVYLGEIAEKKVRGMSMAFLRISMHLGVLLVAIAGAFLSYETMNRALLSIPIAFIISFSFMPETPHFHLMRGEDAKALKTLMKLRGVNNPEAVMMDIQIIKKSIVESKKLETKIWRDLFSKNGCRRSIIVILIAKAAIMYSGNLVIPAFAQEILTESGSSLVPTDAAMILAGFEVLTSLPPSQLIDRFGRRKLFLSTGVATSISLGIIGFYFFLKFNLKSDVSSVTWLPLAGLILYQISINMGFTVVPLIYSAELFPINVKGLAMSFVNIFTGLFSFTSKLAFRGLKNAGGIYVPFWVFSACTVIGACIVFFIAPETKGKSLEEIQEMLNKNNKSRRTRVIEDAELNLNVRI